MAEKQILVRTPETSNGRDVILGPDDKVMYRETILAATARPEIEKINKNKPDILKAKITDYVEKEEKAAKDDKK